MTTHVLENEVELAQLGIQINIKVNTYRQCPKPFSHYLASSSGKIVGSRGNVLSTYINSAGYENVQVKKDNRKYTATTVQHLVALAWLPNPQGLSDVDHKDDNKLNNCVDNLQWISHRDNLTKNHRMEKMSGKHNYCHGRAVLKIYEDGKEKFYKSLSAAARDNDLSVTSVQGSANHTLNLDRPYRFEFAQEEKMEEEA
ncbi:HNH endonuclease [Schleiferilactobacillus harbinensis]|uniref:HNH endonuclease n=1 Tax=Schleiferilactobacillus harbinensis TaxID=304207 RepID=UPI0007B9F70B|nr:HNH endonuclease [Schleiferilactobacillus harbinensis]